MPIQGGGGGGVLPGLVTAGGGGTFLGPLQPKYVTEFCHGWPLPCHLSVFFVFFFASIDIVPCASLQALKPLPHEYCVKSFFWVSLKLGVPAE